MSWNWIQLCLAVAAGAIWVAALTLQMTVMRKQKKLIAEMTQMLKQKCALSGALEKSLDGALRQFAPRASIRVRIEDWYDTTFPRDDQRAASQTNFPATPPGMVQ